jgi:hypothetical protein
VEEVGQSCCADRDAFVFNIDNAVNFYFDEVTQEGVCTIGNLPPCDSIAFIDWGDGNIDVGPFGGNTERRNKLLNHLLARVEYQAHEYDQDAQPDAVCFENIFHDSIPVTGFDTCFCNSFSELFLRGTDGTFERLTECGEPAFALPCLTDGSGYDLTGAFQCIGDQCDQRAVISWTLSGPGGTIPGTAIANPYFVIHLLPAYFGQAGLYTLTLGSQCGNQVCSCVIQFTIDCLPQCDCTALDVSEFYGRVERGFATIYRENSCTLCFTPIALNGCDSVEWHLNSTDVPPIGRSAGQESFCYTFPDAGQYDVIMTVTKKKDDGSKCYKLMRYQQVTFCESSATCEFFFTGNPEFNQGAHAGGLNSGGMSEGWNSVSGEPDVIEGTTGSHDNWTMLLTGNLDTADVLSRAEGFCHNLWYGVFSVHVKSGKSNSSDRVIPGVLTVALGRDRTFPPTYSIKDECEGIDCYEIASIPLPVTDSTEWFDLEIPYDLSYWGTPPDSCTDLVFGVFVRPILYVTNSFGSNQGAEHTYSSAELDNVCFIPGIVAVHDPEQKQGVRIYPNPTTGDLTVELPSAAVDDMMMRVVSVTGQVVMEKRAEAGNAIQTLDLVGLVEGMYFMQILSADRVVVVKRFVKQ